MIRSLSSLRAVSITIGTWEVARISPHSSTPERPGSIRSSTIRSMPYAPGFHHHAAIRRTRHLIAMTLQEARDQQPDLRIVIHHEDMAMIVGNDA
jgi:hypothetical protein